MDDVNYIDYYSFYNARKEIFEHSSILDYTKFLCELINLDFEGFSRSYDQNIVAHGERFKEGCAFRFEAEGGYNIYIITEGYKVKSFQISQVETEQALSSGMIP